MKHLLNNLSSDEKNSIREQYEGGMSIDTSKFKKLLETKLGDAKPLINEDETVSDLERKQLSDKMIKDIVDKYYLDDVVNPTTKVPYQPFNNGGKLDYNKAYRDNMESIDQKLSELGFPNGVHIPENISRQEFDDLKVKWDQASSRLTESGLSRIVKEQSAIPSNEITMLSDLLLLKSVENWYGSPQWMNVPEFKGSTGWVENMSRNESDGKDNHPCIIGGADFDNQVYSEKKWITKDTEIPERCKAYLKDRYTDYLNKFLVKNGFVDGYVVTPENYDQVKKQYDTLQKTNGWKK
jgi:hypothetical protein